MEDNLDRFLDHSGSLGKVAGTLTQRKEHSHSPDLVLLRGTLDHPLPNVCPAGKLPLPLSPHFR